MKNIEDTILSQHKSKKIYIEAMRIFATFFVIFNHTNEEGFVMFATREPGSVLFWLDLANAIFCKFAVPLFFIISGAMMLHKQQESMKELFTKRVLKYFVILVAFSLFYAVSDSILINKETTVDAFLKTIYSTNVKYHLGFLYSYLAYLIMLPLLKSFCKGMENKHFIYLLIIYSINRLLPIVQYLLWKESLTIHSNIAPSLPIYAFVLPLVGYYLEHRVQLDDMQKNIWIIWLINIICIALSCLATYVKGIDTGKFSESESQTYFSNFAFINAISIYCTIKVCFHHIKSHIHIEKWIILIGSLCFGVYLFHPLFKDMPYIKPLLQTLSSSGIPKIIVAWIYVLCLFIPSALLTQLIRKAAKIL